MSLTLKPAGGAAAMRSDDDLIGVMQNSLYPGANADSIRLVLGYCRARGLDPLIKPVHIVPMWDKDTKQTRDVILPGIPLYRIQAARSGAYAGKSEPEFGPDKTMELGGVKVTFPQWCKVTVERIVAGQVRQFTAKEFWLENYATAKRDTDAPNAMWKRRAYGQLAKCTEAQALRMAFPEETGGEPTAEEMEGKSFAGTTIEHHAEPAAAPGSMREVAQQVRQRRAEMDRALDGDTIPALDEPQPQEDKLRLATDRLLAAIRRCDTAAAAQALSQNRYTAALLTQLAEDRPELHDEATAAFGEAFAKEPSPAPLTDAGLPGDPHFPAEQAAAAEAQP